MKIYFSHPTFTFKKKTEKKCIEIIKDNLDVDEIVNPSDFGLKDDMRERVKECDAMVGMAVSSNFTFLVWKEMELAEKHSQKLYTFMVENKRDIGPLVKGVPEKIKKLTKEESKRFAHEITKNDYRDSFMSALIGSRKSRF